MTRPVLPIFVLGLQRSGTTWAANLLAAHPQIAAVEATRHRGVHESVFFSHFAKTYHDWQNPKVKHDFLNAFLKSDYKALSGLSDERVRSLVDQSHTASAFFVAFMEVFARQNHCSAWIEKSPHHTLLAQEIRNAIPSAKFLCITRESKTLVRSRLWSYGRTPPNQPKRALKILRACASNSFHTRFLKRFAAQHSPDQVQLITFEALQDGSEDAINTFLACCGLEPVQQLQPNYKRNSSFASDASRARALTKFDQALISLCDGVVRVLPFWGLQILHRTISGFRTPEFPHWVWAPTTPQSIPTVFDHKLEKK